MSFARAGSSPAFGTKIWRVWMFGLSIYQLLAQQSNFASSPSAVPDRPSMASWPACGQPGVWPDMIQTLWQQVPGF